MIDDVMYGMIPSTKIENWVSAPPEKRLRNPRTPLEPACCLTRRSCSISMPGTGMWVPRRNSAMTAMVKMIFPRSSGTRNMFFSVDTRCLLPS